MPKEIRIPLVTPGLDKALAPIEAEIRAQRGGEIAVLYQALLNSPPIASGWEKLLTAVRNQSTIPADLRELIILRVAVLNRATFEFDAHAPHASAAGVSEKKITAVRDMSLDSTSFEEVERLVLELTDHMTRNVEVPDAVVNELKKRFKAREIVEFVTTAAAYNMVSRFLVALNITH